MKKTLYVIILLSLLGFINEASSEILKLTLDNANGDTLSLNLSQNSDLVVDNSGNVLLTIEKDANELGDELGVSYNGTAPNVDLSVTPTNNSSASINWNISNDAVYCQKTGANWSGLLSGNPLVSNSSVTVSSNGDYSLKCSNAFGSGTGVANVNNIIVAQAPVVTIEADPNSVASGGSVTLKWTISNSPTSCTKSGFWGTDDLSSGDITNGEHTLVISNILEDRSYGLVCQNSAGGSGVKIATIDMTGNAICTAHQPILGGAEDFNPDVYEDISPGSQGGFPGSWGSSVGFNITRNKYVALEFNSGNVVINQAKFSLAIPGNGQGAASLGTTISFSECPGDFSAEPLGQAACRVVGGGTPSIRWSIDPNQSSSNYCNLDPMKTYYLNFVHSNSSGNNFSTSSCPGSSCGILMSPAIIN